MDQSKSVLNLVPLAQLDRLAQEQSFGSMQVTLEVHDKKIVGLTGARFRRKTYKFDGAEDAIQEFLHDLQRYQECKESGAVTLTIKLHKGDVKEMFIQTNFRQVFAADTSVNL